MDINKIAAKLLTLEFEGLPHKEKPYLEIIKNKYDEFVIHFQCVWIVNDKYLETALGYGKTIEDAFKNLASKVEGKVLGVEIDNILYQTKTVTI